MIINSFSGAVFVLSLDCEGLWGMLDQPNLQSSGIINQQSLKRAYQDIYTILDKNEVRATAAFVSLFSVPFDFIQSVGSLIEEQQRLSKGWLDPVCENIRQGPTAMDGFIGYDLAAAALSAGHELGWHGSTHVNWVQASRRSIEIEIELFRLVNEFHGSYPKSFVYPRNLIDKVDMLSAAGINNYRSAVRYNLASRLVSLGKEFTSYNSSKKEQMSSQSGVLSHPVGDFLNWPLGLRKVVSVKSTINRWKAMIDRSVSESGYVHMWFHPHNLITSPQMLVSFQEIMDYVHLRQKERSLVVKTMAEFVK